MNVDGGGSAHIRAVGPSPTHGDASAGSPRGDRGHRGRARGPGRRRVFGRGLQSGDDLRLDLLRPQQDRRRALLLARPVEIVLAVLDRSGDRATKKQRIC